VSVRLDPKVGTFFYRFSRGGISYYQGGFRRKTDAQDAEARKKDETIREEINPAPAGHDLTFRQASQWFYDEYSVKRKADVLLDRGRVRVLQEIFGDKLMREIRPADVQDMRSRLSARGLVDHTVNHYQSLLRAIYNRNTRFGRFDGINPAERVEMVKVPTEKVRYLYPSEEKILTPEIRKDKKLFPYYLAASMTGARVGELCAIRVRDVSLAMGQIFLGKTKTRRSRYIPIADELLPYVKAWMVGKPDDALLLGDFTRMTISHWFTQAVRRVGIKDFTFHCLRHTFVATILSKGESLYRVAKIIGDSLSTTEKHYGHLDPNSLRDAIAKINGFVSGESGNAVSNLQSACSGGFSEAVKTASND
jgi:integrase